MTVKERVLKILFDQTGTKIEELKDEKRLKEDVGMDELDLVEIVMSLEEEFNSSITDEECERWVTVKDVVEAMGEERKE